jgi:putative ABC transport system permease protein
VGLLGVFTFARYAVESVFRNRRRSIYALVGVVIAISLVSGSFIAVDSSALGRLRAALDEVPVDFVGYPYGSDLSSLTTSKNSEICAAIEGVQNVEDAEYVMHTSSWKLSNEDGESVAEGTYYQFYVSYLLDTESDRILLESGIDGEVPEQGTVAIGAELASSLGIVVGDSLLCSCMQYSYDYDSVNGTYIEHWTYVNLTLPVSQVWSQERSGGYDWYYTDALSILGRPAQAVMNAVDLPLLADPLEDAGLTPYLDLSFQVWIDRNAVIDLGDIQGTLADLDFIGNRIDRSVSTYGVYFSSSPLAGALQSVDSDISGMKSLFFGLSMPVVAIGAYLSLVGVDLGVSARRREVGILKSRGASNRQVFVSLFVESVVLGCIAGLLGLMFGVLVSRFLVGTAVTFSAGSGSEASLTDLVIGPSSVVTSVLLGILLMVVSAYRPLKRASKVDAAEALHYYVRGETKIEYKARWDFLALFFVCLSVFSVLTSQNPINIGRGYMLSSIFTLLWLAGIVMLPAMPFLLSVSVVRLLTRGSRKLYSRFTRIVRPWTKELHYLVDKNIVRNPKRASNMCIIIALTLAFGLFISITMETTIGNRIQEIRSQIGSDVRITAYPDWNGTSSTVDLTVLDTVDSVDGVDSSARCYVLSFSLDDGSSYWGGSAAVFDPTAYADTVGLHDPWLGEGDRDKLALIEENGTTLVSESFAEYNYLLVGDILDIRLTDALELSLEVVGVIGDLPGLSASIYVDIGTVSFVPEAWVTSSIMLFVDVHHGYDQSAVADEVAAICNEAGALVSSTEVYDELVAELMDDPTFGALSDFLYMEYALSFIIMCVGVGLVIFVTVSERERELACIMARGSSSSQMRKVLMGESLSLMSLGFVVGATTGIFSAWLFDALLQFVSNNGSVSTSIIIGNVTVAILVASLVSFVLASFLATSRLGRLRLAEVLRIRGG